VDIGGKNRRKRRESRPTPWWAARSEGRGLLAQRPGCAHAARAPGITKIPTAGPGGRMNPVEMSARTKRIVSRKSFLRKSSDRQEREAKAMRTIRRGEVKRVARRRQRDVLREVMLSARECETWLTLDELAKLTHYPPASISAQLRHLRKPQNGGFVVKKRPRTSSVVLRGEDFGTVWEYQLKRGIRKILVRNFALKGGVGTALRTAVC